jgi:hypothetical protein
MLTRRGSKWGFDIDMLLCWEIVATIFLALSFINIVARHSYYFVTKERRARSLPWTLLKISAPVVLYVGCAFYAYFVVRKFNKTIVYEVAPISAFEISSEMTVGTSDVKNKFVMYNANVSLWYCFITPFVFLSKLAFAIFGGAGMALLPMKLIDLYNNRPKQAEPEKHILYKKVLRNSTEALIDEGRAIYDLQRDIQMNTTDNAKELKAKKANLKKRLYEMKYNLIEFEESYEKFDAEDNILESNPLEYLGYLLLGIVTGVASLVIIIHALITVIGIYGILEWGFLRIARYNNILSMFVLFMVFLYLTVAVIYGSVTLSYLSNWAFNTHPVKENGTWTDTFLLNINFSLYGVMGMIIFMTTYCRSYLRFLEVDTLFNKIISRTQLLYFLKKGLIFGYILMLCFLTAFFVSFFLVTNRESMGEKIEEQTRAYKADKAKLQDFETKAEKASLM